MTTSLRAGLASLAQIDSSLDEASATMRAGTFATLRRVVLPLIRPAIVAALGYSFISAMTSISAVIFLTSPRFDMATVNIVGRAEVGEYGYATAYASVLIAPTGDGRPPDPRGRGPTPTSSSAGARGCRHGLGLVSAMRTLTT
jgi:iron(III) transport system permease protein